MNIDPKTVTIQGDLSRNDVIQLCEWCNNKKVVEFGMGGSTLILARCAKELHSYETNKEWYDITTRRIDQIPNKTCEPTLTLNEVGKPYKLNGLPDDIPECDVLWVDGFAPLRKLWINNFFDKAKTIIVHDSRRKEDATEALIIAIDRFDMVESIYLHHEDSNLIIIQKRDKRVAWENWNKVEKHDNRVSWDVEDFIGENK